jgi:outer membrane protein assembly factor BamE (lipoprotein component of BamABCDE complex)
MLPSTSLALSFVRKSTLLMGLGLGLAFGMSACGSLDQEVQPKGYILDEDALASVKPGTDVQSVLKIMGTPSTISTVGNKTFYYISQTTQQRFKFVTPSVSDQRVAAVYFNKNFKVERIANYGMQDGVVFDFISRTTPTGGSEQSFVRNLMRGLGTFNPFGS